MADRKSEYRFRNGETWDRLFFATTMSQIIGEPILGLSYNRDIYASTNGQNVLASDAYPGFVTRTYYATANANNTITIHKTGVYALFSDFHITDRTPDREYLEIYPEINGAQKARLFAPSRSNAANTHSSYTGVKIMKLQSGDSLSIRLNASVASFQIRIDAKTHFALYPLSLG